MEKPEVPETPEEAYVRLQAWFLEQTQLKEIKDHEMLERTHLAAFYFNNPSVGTNRLSVGGGFDLKLIHGYNVTVVAEDLDNVTPEQILELKLPWDDLFVWKPTLNGKTYNQLNAVQQAFVEGLLDIKPASPQLAIVPSKGAEMPIQKTDMAELGREGAFANPAYIKLADHPDSAVPGDYYKDPDAQWWLVAANGDWDQVAAPDPSTIPPPPAATKKRTRKAK